MCRPGRLRRHHPPAPLSLLGSSPRAQSKGKRWLNRGRGLGQGYALAGLRLLPPGALLLRGQAGTASPYTPGGYMSGFPRWPLHKAQAAAATPGHVRPNTAAAPPVALGGESVRRFPVTPVHGGGLRKRRPIAPPCRHTPPARHRWRRCPSTPAPLPPEQPTEGIRGAAGLWSPPHPRDFTHQKTNIRNSPTEQFPQNRPKKKFGCWGHVYLV